MIWLAIMLFMIGQALNMGTGYWVIWGIWIFTKVLGVLVKAVGKNEEDKLEKLIEETLEEIKQDLKKEK